MDERIQNKAVNIELPEEVAQGIYSNLAIISHSSSEFIMDFVRILPGISKNKVKARIVLTPEHAKRVLLALQDNIVKYETQFGPIRNPQSAMPPLGFSTGEA